MSEILDKVRSVCGDNHSSLHVPFITIKEKHYVDEVLQSTHLSSGPVVTHFEHMLCRATNSKYAVATINGTAALHVAIECLWPKGSVIKIPSLTFIATASAVLQAGMIPEFCELEDAELPVDLNGFIFGQGRLRDSAQALATPLNGTRVYSFNQNKTIACIGGAVVTDDEELATRIRHLTTTARISHPYKIEHTQPAYNYRLSDVCAAIGVGQMESLPTILKAKTNLHKRYCKVFGEMIWQQGSITPWLTTILVPNRDEVLEELQTAGYMARCLPTPLHLSLPQYKCGDVSRSVELWQRAVCLPSSPILGMRNL